MRGSFELPRADLLALEGIETDGSTSGLDGVPASRRRSGLDTSE